MKRYLPFVTVILSATLAACGGGGGSDSAASNAPADTKSIVDPYVGTWETCLKTAVSDSEKVVVELTKQSSMVLEYKATLSTYTRSALCQGVATSEQVEGGTFTFDGTTKMASDPQSSTMVVVDKMIADPANPAFSTLPQVIRLEGGTSLRLGSYDVVDPQGYPEALLALEYLKH